MATVELLTLGTYLHAGCTVLAVRGDVDAYTADALRTQLLELVRAGHRNLIVDLGEVEFMDSTGLGVLVGAHRRLHGAGTLCVVCPRESIRKLFQITGLHRVFPLHRSVDDAVGVMAVARAGDREPGVDGPERTLGHG